MFRRFIRSPRAQRGFALTALAALIGLAISGTAVAGEKEEAKRHFKAGMEAVRNGDYEKGITELKAAYDILPHPNVLYNIARAYAESGDLENAIGYYRKYLAENPPDKDDIEQVVKSLEARLAKSKAAAQAAAAAAGGTGTGGTGGTTGTGGTAGTGTGGTGENGGTGASGTGGGTTGGTGTGTPSKGGGTGTAPGAGDLGASKEENVYETKVVTASKGEQSPLDSPSSTYVITEQDIRLSGAQTIPELLERVPGIDTAQMTPADYNLSIRGFNSRLSNKLLVLVNGRSVYLDFLGTTFWDALSINVEDIERIEVVRGPGSALYGADAFTGVVNIITKEPGEGKNGLSASAGSQKGAPVSYARGALWATGKASGWNYRISAGYDRYPRWTREVASTRTDLGWFDNNYDLAGQHSRVDVRFTRRIGKDITFGIGGGYVQLQRNFYAIAALTDMNTTARLADVTTFINSKHFNARAFLYSLDAVAGRSAYYLGDPSYRTNARSNIFDVELQYANEFDTGPAKHDVRIGVGYRYKDIFFNYLDKDFRVEHHRNAYLQDLVKIGEHWDVLGSLRADYVPYLSKIIPSPRGSIIYKRTKGDAFRFTVSSAFRKPAYIESYLDFPVTTPLSGAEVPVQANKVDDSAFRVQPEKILSFETGYQNQASDYFTFEVNAYYNRVTDLIVLSQLRAQTPTSFAKGAGGFNESTSRYTAFFGGWENDCQVFHSYGGEVSVKAYPVSGLDLYLSYAYNDVKQVAPSGCTATVKDQRTSHHKIIAGTQLRTTMGLDAELDLLYQSHQVWAEQQQNIETRQIEYLQYDLSSFPTLQGRIGYRFKFEPLDIGLVAYNILNTSIREHPFAQVQGRRVLLMATYRY